MFLRRSSCAEAERDENTMSQESGTPQDEPQVIRFVDEGDQEIEMIIVDQFKYGGKSYVLLIDREQPEEDGVLMRVEQDELLNIEDDEEWERVSAAYEQLS